MSVTLASTPHQEALPGTSGRPADVPRRHYSLASLRSIVVIWSERIRVRWELQQMSKANPHLIDDIGLTPRQVEAEIARPFWQPSIRRVLR